MSNKFISIYDGDHLTNKDKDRLSYSIDKTNETISLF